jgi:ATP-dependent RNA helicase RhlB
LSLIKKIKSVFGKKEHPQQEASEQKNMKAPASTRKQQSATSAIQEEWRPGRGSTKAAGAGRPSGPMARQQEGGVAGEGGASRPRRKPPAPRSDAPQGDRPAGDRPRGERPQGDRPRGDRPAGDRPRGDRPRGDRPAGDRPRSDRPQGERKPREPRKPSPPREPREEVPVAVVEETPWDPAVFKVEPQEGKIRFQDLNLHEKLLHGIYDLGWQYCTPIQGEILPGTLQGKDMAGRAQTGTGKTAAFLISIINHCLNKPLAKQTVGHPRALIIAPTRELAMQIKNDADGLTKYTGLRTVVLYGGMDYNKQQRYLEEGKVDIVVATPGRLLDFEGKGVLGLRFVEIMVIDEADRMLDMGFIPDVRRIINKTPAKENRQTVLFSATLSEEVMRLAAAWMIDPVRIDIEPDQVAGESIDQQVFIVTDKEKFPLLYNIIQGDNPDRMIIFTNRRDQAERLTEELTRYSLRCEMLSGAVSQKRRMRILEDFREGKVKTLVATDVAGRGIHVDGVSHVVNFNIPENPDDYVHRIGRTGRAGALGKSITFACEMESFELPAIEKNLGIELKCKMPPEELLKELPEAPPRQRRPRREDAGNGPRGGSRGGSRSQGGGPRRSGSGARRPNSGPRRSGGAARPQGDHKPSGGAAPQPAGE